MKLVIESTKTNAGTRKLPMTEEVAECFRGIIEDREPPRFEKVIDGYSGFLFVDKDCNAEHHAPCLPPHLLQQHGKVGNESKDASVPDGA